MQEAEKITLCNNDAVAHMEERLKVWQDQMVNNEKILAQVGDIKNLM